MSTEEILKALFGTGAIGGAAVLLWKAANFWTRRVDSSIREGEAATNSKMSMLEFLQQQLRDQQILIETLRRENSETGRFAARAELLATQVQEMAKLATDLKNEAAQMRSEIHARDAMINRLRLQLVRAGIAVDDFHPEPHDDPEHH